MMTTSMSGSRSPAVAGSTREREIVAAEVIVTCPGRNFVTLKIATRSGVTGPRRCHAQRPRAGGGLVPARTTSCPT